MILAAFCRVVGWNGQLRRSGILNLEGLDVAAGVSAVVRHSPCAGDRVSLWTCTALDGFFELHGHRLAVVTGSQDVCGRNRITFDGCVCRKRFVEGDGDRLDLCVAVSALIRGCERPSHRVGLGAVTGQGVYHHDKGHFTTVVVS